MCLVSEFKLTPVLYEKSTSGEKKRTCLKVVNVRVFGKCHHNLCGMLELNFKSLKPKHLLASVPRVMPIPTSSSLGLSGGVESFSWRRQGYAVHIHFNALEC